MLSPKNHPRETERLRELHSYAILDTLPQEEYDRITTIASEICETPISLISLLDESRQWFKSRQGLEVNETPRDIAFCAHAITCEEELFMVEDARLDERFHDNPLVQDDPHIVFYAGVQLKAKNGLPLGTLCVIDSRPRQLSQKQISALQALADYTMSLLQLRRQNKALNEAQKQLKAINNDLEQFAALAAHDLKTPLGQLQSVAKIFIDLYGEQVNDQGREMLEMMITATKSLADLVDGLLLFSKSDELTRKTDAVIGLESFMAKIRAIFNFSSDCHLRLRTDLTEITANPSALERIFINLIANAYKYCDKSKCEIDIYLREDAHYFYFEVIDNGPGIPLKNQGNIFEMFTTVAPGHQHAEKGHGIGLAQVKKLVEFMGGKIRLDSQPGKGCCFSFSIQKKPQPVISESQ